MLLINLTSIIWIADMNIQFVTHCWCIKILILYHKIYAYTGTLYIESFFTMVASFSFSTIARHSRFIVDFTIYNLTPSIYWLFSVGDWLIFVHHHGYAILYILKFFSILHASKNFTFVEFYFFKNIIRNSCSMVYEYYNC